MKYEFEVQEVYEGSNNIVYKEKEYGTDIFTLKWDGCINYEELNGTYGEVHQYLHICDIDAMIAKLQEIKRLGGEHFNNEFWIK